SIYLGSACTPSCPEAALRAGRQLRVRRVLRWSLVQDWYNGSRRCRMRPSIAMRGNREQILEIAERYGARNVRVFGSVARAEDTEKSDLDLLVDMDEDRSYWDLGLLTEDVKDLLGCEVQIVPSDGLHRRLRDRILREATAL